ncbi:MAG: hypothetical protein O7A98_00850 [Acidobacteria bacterium]|nr:hypothetical protein [Acidobacteriota bacterium]
MAKLAMRLGRRHWLSLVALAACAVAYVANVVLAEVRPGSIWSVGYGAAALALLVVAGAYGLRRRAMAVASRRRAGSASAWLAVHVYGSALFLLLVMMHSGFGLPTGWVTWWLWGLSLWTVASGLVGLALQRWIPRLLTSGLAVEVHYDRIPELVEELGQRAAKLAAASSEEVARLYERVVAPELARPVRRMLYFFDITGGIQSKLREFRYLSRFLGSEQLEALAQLEQLYRTKLEIDAHYTLQQPLRWWLSLHLPAALLLAVFVILHLVSVFLY